MTRRSRREIESQLDKLSVRKTDSDESVVVLINDTRTGDYYHRWESDDPVDPEDVDADVVFLNNIVETGYDTE